MTSDIQSQANAAHPAPLRSLVLLAVLGATSVLLASRWAPEFVSLYWQWPLTLAAFILVAQIPAVGQTGLRVSERLVDALTRRGAFQSDAAREMPKFGLLRIAFGALLTHRAIALVVLPLPGDLTSPPLAFFLILNLVAAFAVTLGCFTQLALVFLVVLQWQLGDAVLLTGTLGNDVGAILAILLLMANAGAHLSIDRWMMQRKGTLGAVISRFYHPDGMPPDSVLQLSKLAALFSYWLVCLYSLSMHLNEVAWTTGYGGPILLSNNLMSRPFEGFIWLFSNAPWAVQFARVSLWIMMAWYALLLPAVLFGGWVRQAAIVWGFLFFCLSSVVLQLGWLGAFEFVLWAALFWRHSFIDGTRDLAIVYDDRCNLCDRTVNGLLRVDVFGQLTFRPLSRNKPFLAERGIETKAALTDLYGVSLSGRHANLSGYDLYMAISRRLLLLTPAYPILLVGKILWVGPLIYRFIAARRTKLFGVCELPTPKPEPRVSWFLDPARRPLGRTDFALPLLSHIAVAGVAFLLVMPAPFVGWQGVPLPSPLRPVTESLAGQAHMFGISPINVFNAADLRMAENWFTISAVDADGTEHLLPVFSENGGRLDWHVSDRIYFGYTLRWRRGFVEGPPVCRIEASPMFAAFVDLYEAQTRQVRQSYVYRQYHQPLPDGDDIRSGRFILPEATVFCAGTLVHSDGEPRGLSVLSAQLGDLP